MDLVWTVLTFCFGVGLLVKGSDWLVDASARIAKQFGVSNFVIGLTVVALGTSLPEFGAVLTASILGNNGLIMGGIVGSNIANLALIMGLAGLFVPIGLKRNIYNRDGLVMLSSTAVFYLFCLDGILSRWEGFLFVVFFVFYLVPLVYTRKKFKKELHYRKYLQEYAGIKKKQSFENVPVVVRGFWRELHKHFVQKLVSVTSDLNRLAKRTKASIERNWKRIRTKKAALAYLSKQLAIMGIGAVCIFFGANFLVTSAFSLPVNQVVVGLVFVAIGTSLPELSVTISSLRKGLPEIMIGNLIGSNIANVLWVGGISALIRPVSVPISVLTMDFVFLLLIVWLFLVFLRNDRKITKIESITLLLLYFAFVATAFGLRA